MNINHLISIGLYISGIAVYAIFLSKELGHLISTEYKEDFDNLVLPENLWPIAVVFIVIVYVVLCCIWPFWLIQDLWYSIKRAFKKT